MAVNALREAHTAIASNHRYKVNPALPVVTDTLQPLPQSSIGLTGFKSLQHPELPIGHTRNLQDSCKISKLM